MTDNLPVENQETARDKLNNFIKEKNLSLSSSFVPFSISRNSKEKHKSLNWKVTLSNGKEHLTIDYSKGVGHLPYPDISYANIQIKNIVSKQIDHAVENGNGLKVIINKNHADLSLKQIKFPHPEMEEVLQCLVSDSNVRNYLSFEDWASDFGYDEDSRKAEKIYVESQKITSSFAKLVGGVDNITMLEELIQEIENEDNPKPKKMKM